MTVAVAMTLLLAGCGTSQQASEPSSTEAATSAADTTTAAAEDSDYPGTSEADYEDATSPEAINGRKIYEDNGTIEDMAGAINELLKLPVDIPVVGYQCDDVNAMWDPDDKAMIICYEFVDFAQQMFTDAGDADPIESALNATYATFFHEMGHMVIDLYDLPITGREEDVADQLSAFMLLYPDEAGQVDPESVAVLRDDARLFAAFSEFDAMDESTFADEHSLSQARMYNLLCWAYGADPDMNADLVDNELLPQDRAVQCEHEYNQINNAWNTLLAPYVK